MEPFNIVTQTFAIDIIQLLIARGDTDPVTIDTIEAVVVGKLFSCIHGGKLDLQNKLLHILHSLISSSVTHDKFASGKHREDDGINDRMGSQEKLHASVARSYTVHSLLVQTLVDGIATPSNRPISQHWMDFILTAVPQFQPALQAVVTPLNACLCHQLRSSLNDLLKASSRTQDFAQDISAGTTDAELVMLLNGLERFVLLGLTTTSENNVSEDDPSPAEKTTPEPGGLLGIVTNVFGTDTSQTTADEQFTVLFSYF
jgi:hypothetical protein